MDHHCLMFFEPVPCLSFNRENAIMLMPCCCCLHKHDLEGQLPGLPVSNGCYLCNFAAQEPKNILQASSPSTRHGIVFPMELKAWPSVFSRGLPHLFESLAWLSAHLSSFLRSWWSRISLSRMISAQDGLTLGSGCQHFWMSRFRSSGVSASILGLSCLIATCTMICAGNASAHRATLSSCCSGTQLQIRMHVATCKILTQVRASRGQLVLTRCVCIGSCIARSQSTVSRAALAFGTIAGIRCCFLARHVTVGWHPVRPAHRGC